MIYTIVYIYIAILEDIYQWFQNFFHYDPFLIILNLKIYYDQMKNVLIYFILWLHIIRQLNPSVNRIYSKYKLLLFNP